MTEQATAIELRASTQIAETGMSDQDGRLLDLWLNNRGKNTQRAYRRGAGRFFGFVRKPLNQVMFEDLQKYNDHLAGQSLEASSIYSELSSIKSLFAFGAKLGYLPFDVSLPLRLPGFRATLAKRILSEDDVSRLIAAATSPRNRLILKLVYLTGGRVSEVAGLTWEDAIAHRGGGQITVFGKGAKTRTIRLEPDAWAKLIATRGAALPGDPVFKSRRGGHLHPSQILRIVKAAAKKAGLSKAVSTHWLRHCHASHALDHGAPLHLVQQTLGHASIATTSKYLHARPHESSSRFLPQI